MEVIKKRRSKAAPLPPEKDIERLKSVTRKLLGKLEEELMQADPASEEESALLQRHHDRLFGSKNSLVTTLSLLVELMLKLEQASSADVGIIESSRQPLSDADIALVEAFIQTQPVISQPA